MSKHPSSSVYLASQSPRRHALLAQWGVTPVALLADAHEDAEALEAVLPGEAPLRYVKRVTALKLAAAADRCTRRSLPPLPVVCADTTVALGREILGKPNSMAHARRMLTLLSGQKHVVYTAVSVGYWDARGTWQTQQMVSRSQVRFSSLSATQIASYVKTGEPMGK
ncbi:MAG: Maf family protein, partial [Burkholderiaceae bacterium]|nr:Maf family protein [Burkholderiaceae bacterium]